MQKCSSIHVVIHDAGIDKINNIGKDADKKSN